jgi:hypothetical protein
MQQALRHAGDRGHPDEPMLEHAIHLMQALIAANHGYRQALRSVRSHLGSAQFLLGEADAAMPSVREVLRRADEHIALAVHD